MKRLYTLIFALVAALAVHAQDYRIDLNIRGNTMVLLEDGDEVNSREFRQFPVGASAEALFFPKDFVGIGVFYLRSVMSGKFEYYQGGDYTAAYPTTDYDYAMYGLSLQLGTNRKRGFRVYAVGRAGKFEFVEDAHGFSIADSEFAYSGGLGIMVKLSRRMSFNVFEANYSFLPKEFSVGNDEEIASIYVQSGVSIKLLPRK
jgi:hypothetical protein